MPRSLENVNRLKSSTPGLNQYTTICEIMPTYQVRKRKKGLPDGTLGAQACLLDAQKTRKAGTLADSCFPSHKEEKGVSALYYSWCGIQ